MGTTSEREKPLVCIHIRDETRHRISDKHESLPITLPWVDPQDSLHNLLCMFHRLASDPRQLDVMCKCKCK